MDKFKTNLIFLMVLLFGLISMVGVNAGILKGPTIGIHNVSEAANTSFTGVNFGYGGGASVGWNLTNLSSNRPFIRFNITIVGHNNLTSGDQTYNVTLEVYLAACTLGYSFVPGTTSGYPNLTVA